MATSQEPLSVRNNNPGNLRFVGQEGATPGEGGFARFETREAGLNAMRKQIELDTQTRGMNLTQFLGKYAPPSENKTQSYVDFVVRKTGVDPTAPISPDQIPAIQAAMIEMEGGQRAANLFKVSPTVQVAQAPAPKTEAAVPRTTKPAEFTQVASASPPTSVKPAITDLPPSYRAALAANYIADTEDPEVSIADKAMAMLEEMQTSGGGPRGAATFMRSMGQEESPNPFAVMAKAQEPEPRRRVVPKMPVLRMADGGDVSNEVPRVDAQGRVIREAPTPEVPRSLKERIIGGGEAALSLLSGITAPASIIYDVARGVPRDKVSPSQFMYTPRTEGGQRTAEELGRFMQEYKLDAVTPQVQLMRPLPVAASARQGITALERGAEKLGTGAVRKITGKEDITPEQIYQAMGDTEGIMQLGAPAATKPGGGVTFSSGLLFQLEGLLLNEASNRYKTRTGVTEHPWYEPPFSNSPEAKQLYAAQDWLKKKAPPYFEKQYGSPNDPMLKAFIEEDYTPNFLGKLTEKDMAKIAQAREMLGSNDPTVNDQGKQILSKYYDMATPVEIQYGLSTIRNRLLNPRYRADIEQYIREEKQLGLDELSKVEMDSILDKYAKGDELDSRYFNEADVKDAFAMNLVDNVANKITTQGGRYGNLEKFLRYEKDYPFSFTSDIQKQEVLRGEPVYVVPTFDSQALIKHMELLTYLMDTPKEKWQKKTFPELLQMMDKDYARITDPQVIHDRIDNYRPVTTEQRLIGTKGYMPVESDTLGKGAGWREIVDKGGILIEGRLLKHCLSRDPKYASFLENNMSKFFALRDKQGKSYATIQIDRLGESGPFANVHQIKGFKNDSVANEYGKEIMDFLNTYEKQLGVPLRYTEFPEFLPKQVRDQSKHEKVQGFAKGGIVDKPLYDRAV